MTIRKCDVCRKEVGQLFWLGKYSLNGGYSDAHLVTDGVKEVCDECISLLRAAWQEAIDIGAKTSEAAYKKLVSKLQDGAI